MCLFTTRKAVWISDMTPLKGIVIDTEGLGQHGWCVGGIIRSVGDHLVCQINHFQDRETTDTLIDRVANIGETQVIHIGDVDTESDVHHGCEQLTTKEASAGATWINERARKDTNWPILWEEIVDVKATVKRCCITKARAYITKYDRRVETDISDTAWFRSRPLLSQVAARIITIPGEVTRTTVVFLGVCTEITW